MTVLLSGEETREELSSNRSFQSNEGLIGVVVGVISAEGSGKASLAFVSASSSSLLVSDSLLKSSGRVFAEENIGNESVPLSTVSQRGRLRGARWKRVLLKSGRGGACFGGSFGGNSSRTLAASVSS